jgi:hypothetical protein
VFVNQGRETQFSSQAGVLAEEARVNANTLPYSAALRNARTTEDIAHRQAALEL